MAQLAELLGIPLFSCEIDIAREAGRTGENVEAVARRERYLAANEALESLCRHAADRWPTAASSRPIRPTTGWRASTCAPSWAPGPGGFRAMRYRNGPVVRPLLDASRDDLRAYLVERERAGEPVAVDAEGRLWREDATNAHTDRFRAYVRHEIVPRAKERNPQLLDVLCRSMNLIADEDDMLEAQAEALAAAMRRGSNGRRPSASTTAPDACWPPRWASSRARCSAAPSCACWASCWAPRRAWRRRRWKPCWPPTTMPRPRGGYVANIQGDLAVSANKRGVRIEPMAAFRARRKRK